MEDSAQTVRFSPRRSLLASFAHEHDLLGCQSWPTIRGVHWFNCAVLASSLCVGLYGVFHVQVQTATYLFSVAYFFFSMLGITAGYHRLWSHRSYKAVYPLQVVLLLAGASAVQGSCLWWSRLHRSHHRYTDTEKDPYNSNRGLFWTHIGWMMFKSDTRAGGVDATDLHKDPLIRWQHDQYLPIALVWGFVLPAVVPGLLWGDWIGGLCYACALRMTLEHHSTFCINSIAHYLGDKPYDDRHSPRDNLASAILTMGEGYHNFHHQFPMDYRNAFRWYQYDPTKWFIAGCEFVGLTRHLRRFPHNEIQKSAFAMKIKALKREQDTIEWPGTTKTLPVVPWDVFQAEATTRILILVSGFIHDVTDFVDDHPGGPTLLISNSGKDMTAAFFGGVYEHSNAAHNLLAMKRVAILAGGVEHVDGQLRSEVHPPVLNRLLITETSVYAD